jgi:dipeptide/tripeptide permease
MPYDSIGVPDYGSLAHPVTSDDFPLARPTPASGKQQEDVKLLIFSVVLICGMTLSEELATQTFDGTQIFFMSNLQMDTQLNDGMKFARDRVYMVFLLLCAKLGDNGLGRFETVVLGAIVFVGGTVMVSLATNPWISRLVWYLLGAFLVLPFSQAAISANLSNFGADQFDLRLEGHQALQERFFWWFNVANFSGLGLAYALLACYGVSVETTMYLVGPQRETELERQISGGLGEPSAYWTVFIASTIFFLIAIALFTSGREYYTEKSCQQLPSSPVVAVTQYLVKAGGECSFQGAMLLLAKVVGITIYVGQAALFWSPQLARPLSFASAIGVVFSLIGILFFCQRLEWMDNIARVESQPMSKRDIKEFFRFLPLIVCSQIAYGCLYMMMRTWYIRQTCQMDLRYDWTMYPDSPEGHFIFTAFFDIINCGTVIIGTPLALFFVNPFIEKMCERVGRGWHFNDWTKFLVGMAFALLSVALAGHYEVCRRRAHILDLTSPCAPDGVGVRDIRAYWMIIPYMLMGVSSVYVVPTLMMLSYRQVPRTVRSLTVVTNIFMMSASQSMVTAISLFMEEYAPYNLDTGNLEYLYWAGLALSLILLALFATLVPYYQSKYYDDTAPYRPPAAGSGADAAFTAA